MPELPLVGEEFAGYRLTAILGRGGMSTVFRAENPRLGNVIALKVLDPALARDDIFRARFLEESRIAASMNHPNVIPIHDTGSSDGLLYIAMRCVNGTDLRQVLKKRGRLPPGTSVFLLEQAARALDAAHRRGLVHRDVKPGNLLVERGNEGTDPDHLYLTDFGITKHQGDRTGLTSTEQFLGTIDYVAPEQICGTPVLGLADQYSLGCVLYECLTGHVPFEKDLNAAILWAHVEEAPTLPTTLRPDLPPAIDDVVARVLAKYPGNRYDSCKEFMAAAREALGGMAEPARRPRPLVPLPVSDQPAELAHETAGASRARDAGWGAGWAVLAPDPFLPEPPPPRACAQDGPPSGPGGQRRPRRPLLAGIAALVLVAGGAAGITLSVAGGHGAAAGAPAGRSSPVARSSPAPKASAGMPLPASSMAASSAAPAQSARTADCTPTGSVAKAANNEGNSGPATLAGVLRQADLCSSPEGDIPASSCTSPRPTVINCTSPAKGIATVTFETYPTLTALYTAYQQQIQLANGSFSQNTRTRCSNEIAAYAETGWNHVEDHPTRYTVAQMESPGFNQVDAMGRQACFLAGGKPYLIWTTDVGKMLAVARGSDAMAPVYTWWAQVHHVLIFPGTIMCGQNMAHMADAPQGNLISVPQCPAGVNPAPGTGGM